MILRRLLPPVLAALLVFTCTDTSSASGTITAKPVKTGLDFPAAFTFAPDGTIFFGEKSTGAIRTLNPSTGTTHLFFQVPNVASSGEEGLLGIALHPHFPTTPYVYAYATRSVHGKLHNQIVRVTDAGGKGTEMRVIFTATSPPYVDHDGGHIAFGPDGKLYVVIGEGTHPARSQNLKVTGGKILRMTATGGVPGSNPFAGSPVWAYGIRNSFGFAFDPGSGHLWETENGPECNDELNRIVKGANEGWGPSETCSTPPSPPANTNQDGPNPDLPEAWYGTTIAPTGAAFCDRCGLDAPGRLFFGAYNTGEIRSVTLTPDGLGVASQEVAYTHGTAVLSLAVGPNHAIYFSDPSGIYRLVRT